jgi:hypothetical protein
LLLRPPSDEGKRSISSSLESASGVGDVGTVVNADWVLASAKLRLRYPAVVSDGQPGVTTFSEGTVRECASKKSRKGDRLAEGTLCHVCEWADVIGQENRTVLKEGYSVEDLCRDTTMHP